MRARRTASGWIDLANLLPVPAPVARRIGPTSLRRAFDDSGDKVGVLLLVHLRKAHVNRAAFVYALQASKWIGGTAVAADAIDEVHAIGGKAERGEQPRGDNLC